MVNSSQCIIALARECLPPALFRALTMYHPQALKFYWQHRELLKKNHALANRHSGERCFILCNGPSVNTQDIRPLKDETVFSVSSGYLHPHFAQIAPRYHCVPQITYSPKITEDVVCDWFKEMHGALGNAELFLAHQEYDLVQAQQLFMGRTVHYLCLGLQHMPLRRRRPYDLDNQQPRPQSVPVMAVLIALAMGFKEIHLLGVDHDWFVKKEYVYSYTPTILANRDIGVGPNGIIESTLLDDLPMVQKLWSQYRAIRHIAEATDVKIYNATAGGMLDEFPRVKLEEVVRT